MRNRMPPLCRPFLLAMLIATGAEAVPVKIVGFEDMSCRAWAESREDAGQRAAYLAWIRGVLTGHNYANQRQQVSAVSTGTVENFVDRYCVEKPGGDFGEAAMRMTDRFSGRNSAITK